MSNVSGEQGLGFFRLNVAIEFVIEPAGSAAGQPELPQLTGLTAEARIGGKLIGRFLTDPAYFPIRSYPERTNRQFVPLTCDLDRARTEAIENVRAGGHLALDILIQPATEMRSA